MRPGLAVACALALAMAACSDGGEDGADTTISDVTSPTTDAPPTTPPATDAPPETTAVEPTDPPAPTTTLDPTEALIAEIEADLNEGEQVVIAGGRAPGSASSRANLERYFAGKALEVLLDFYSQLAIDGLVVRPNPQVPTVIEITRVVSHEEDEAIIEYCRVDSSAIVELAPDGSERIVNDSIVRSDNRVAVSLVGDVWVNTGGGELLAEEVGVEACD